MLSSRLIYFLLAIICAGLLGFGYFLQFVNGIEPCPLCIFQRIAYITIIIIAFVAMIHAPEKTGVRIYNSLLFISAISGAAIAGRQVWLQHLPPDQVPECGPGLDYMLEAFSVNETLKMVFTGSGECAEVQWTFISLSIPEWSLICFLLIACVTIIHAVKVRTG